MSIEVFRLPDAGEGLTEAEIIAWRVKPGDTVAVNDPIVEIETAKSLVELPCPFAGTVSELLVPEGATVPVGAPIISVDRTDVATPATPAAAPIEPVTADADPTHQPGDSPSRPARTAVLVGYGPRTTGPTSRRRRPAPVAAVPAAAVPVVPIAEPESVPAPVAVPEPVVPVAVPEPAGRALAKPPVRKLARDLGVDLAVVPASGRGGVVTRADVEQAARAVPSTDANTAIVPRPVDRQASTEPTERETRIPVRGVRKATAAAMVASAFSAPHVTEWVQVDVTRAVRLVDRLRTDPGFAQVKVSPLLLVARAVLLAARRHPGINASWDAEAGEIVVKHYVNLGIAVATPRGLVVPNVKDADRLDLAGLAAALGDLAETARAGRATPAEQAGGTFTITNVGVFGVDGGTPILNPGEAAILAVGQIRQLPWVHKGKVRPRWVSTLSLSFDHRLVDGDLGSRFLADVAALLHNPSVAVLW